MTRAQFAAKHNMTVNQLKEEELEFLNSEGYDEDGNEYDTFGEWINRNKTKVHNDPFQKSDDLDN